ncbi:MAG: hypothetical protein ACFFCD_04315 [Promethearchaeota archaeon]
MQTKSYFYTITKTQIRIAILIAIINVMLVMGSYTLIGISWTEIFYITSPPSPALSYVGPNLATSLYFLSIVGGLLLIQKIRQCAITATEKIPVNELRENATKQMNLIYCSLIPIFLGIVFSGGHIFYNLSMTGLTAKNFVFYNIYSIFPDFIIGYLAWFCVGSVYFIFYLGHLYISEKTSLTPDQTFGFSPLTRFGLTSATAWGFVGIIILPLMVYFPNDPLSTLLVFSGVTAYGTSVALFYFLPLLGVNRKLTALKNEKAETISKALYERINGVMRGLDMRLDIPSDYFIELLGLDVINKRTESINVWGINSRIAGRLISMAILPILSYVLKYLVQLYVPGILLL